MTEVERLRAALDAICFLADDDIADRSAEIIAVATAALATPQPTPDTRPALTPRQAEVLAFIRESIAIRGYAPTVREIAKAQGVNHSVIQRALKALESNGYVRHEPRTSRTLSVVEAS